MHRSMRIIAFVTEVGFIQRILAYLGEPTQAPRVAPAARVPPGWDEDFDTREGDTFALSERAASESQGQGVVLLGARRRFPPAPGPFQTFKSPPSPSDQAGSIASPR